MKKVLSLILIIQLVALPVLAEYDFSDEAQAEFDRQHSQQMYYPQNVDFSKTRVKKDIKETTSETQERIHYTPAPVETTDLPVPVETTIDLPIQSDSQRQYLPVQGDLLKEIEQNNQTIQNQYSNKYYGSVVKVPAGTKFDVTFDSGISSGSLEKNDRLTVRLTNDLICNGQVIIPAGSLVYGTATDARNAGYAYGSGAVELNFNEILTPDGNMLQISTKKIIMKAKSERAGKMTRDVVLGALGSMLLGAAFTAMGGGADWGRNMLIYGGIGALGGGVHGAMQRGEELSIPDGTTINVTLTEPFTAPPYEL